jgi:serine/threonine protein phosphatase PrpC
MDKECRGKFKRSGTTATLAVSVGWELVVANVGDSCAYLDTGAEVVQLTCNHRVAENAEERARILAEGGEAGSGYGGGGGGGKDMCRSGDPGGTIG